MNMKAKMTHLGSLPLALVQGERPRVVVSGHGDHCVSVEGPTAWLVHCVPRDGGGGVAGPVQSIPGSVISQALHWAHVCRDRI